MLLMLNAVPASAQPAPGAPAAAVVLGAAAEFYAYRTLEIDSHDGLRHYRLHVFIPRRVAPPTGHPVWFMLDGNAAAERIDAALLGRLAAGAAPVIVAIGYASGLRFDVDSRAYDYTPALPGGGEQNDEPFSDRRTGGANAFLDLIERRIKPVVAAMVPLDPMRQGLWGHSYGGMFVLHTLLARPGSFRCYAAASPSLWWKEGYLLQREAELADRLRGLPLQVLLLRGSAENAGRTAADDASRRRLAVRSSVPEDAARALDARLAARAIASQYLELPGANHGQAFAESISPSLHWFERCIAGAG